MIFQTDGVMAGLGWLVAWRAAWALVSRSYYVPDETWQSVEVGLVGWWTH